MGWWEKKLGTPAAGPRVPVVAPGVVQAPPGVMLPNGVGMSPAQVAAYQQQQAAMAPVAPTIAELGYDPATEIPAGVAIRSWQGDPRGGALDTATLGNCPACGSPRFLSRSSEAKMMANGQMANPMPECFECGYPRQQGTLGVGAKAQGAARAARQGAMMPLAIDKPQAQV